VFEGRDAAKLLVQVERNAGGLQDLERCRSDLRADTVARNTVMLRELTAIRHQALCPWHGYEYRLRTAAPRRRSPRNLRPIGAAA